MPPLMTTLPLEVLDRICRYLDHVLDFALTNKRCLVASYPVLYSDIRIFYTSPSALRQDVTRWLTLLQRTKSLQHPRRLELKTRIIFNVGRVDNPPDPAGENLHSKWQKLQNEDLVEPGDQTDRNWYPVVELIDKLAGLSDIVYACQEQLAPCVLDAIEKKNCRLFLNTFCLRSLIQRPHDSPRVSPYETRLATSRCLYSITCLEFEKFDDCGRMNFLEEACLTMASGVTPNLAEVSLRFAAVFGSLGYYTNSQQPLGQWLGTELGPKPTTGSANILTSLELDGNSICSLELLKKWSPTTNLADLITLKLRRDVCSNVLGWLTQDIELTKLQSLTLCFNPGGHLYDAEADGELENAEFDQLIFEFFTSLPPLRTLQLMGNLPRSSLANILSLQGPNLQELSLFTRSIEDQCNHLQLDDSTWDCSLVTDLHTNVSRSNGDAQEVRQYELIGKRFPNLRRVRILPDFIDSGTSNPELSPDSNTLHRAWNGEKFDLAYILRNHAIDASLVKAIFRKISAAKPPGSPPLQQLEVRIKQQKGSGLVPHEFWQLYTSAIDRSWICIVSSESNGDETIFVKSVDYQPINTAEGEKGWMRNVQMKRIFQDIWPSQPGQAWYDSWHSFPLSE